MKKVMNSGKLYKVMEFTEQDPHYREYLQRMEEYNQLGYSPEAEAAKQEILRGLFAQVGDGAYIQAPYRAMWSGRHVHLGRNVYINFNCTLVDDAQIYIGDGTMIAPNVTIVAASHPVRRSSGRRAMAATSPCISAETCGSRPTSPFCSGCISETIIGAGSIVTKDVPANVIAMGSPAKVVREITPDDDVHYDHGKLIADNIVTLDALQQWG